MKSSGNTITTDVIRPAFCPVRFLGILGLRSVSSIPVPGITLQYLSYGLLSAKHYYSRDSSAITVVFRTVIGSRSTSRAYAYISNMKKKDRNFPSGNSECLQNVSIYTLDNIYERWFDINRRPFVIHSSFEAGDFGDDTWFSKSDNRASKTAVKNI